MDEKDRSQNKTETSTKARMSKRCADLDKLIDAHCKKHGITRSSCEQQHARVFNENAHYLHRQNLYVIEGILANDARELMICFVAKSEGLATVHGFTYTVIRADDG